MTELKKQLVEFQEEFQKNVPEDIGQIIHEAIEGLKKSGISQNALKIGDKITDFKLTNADKKECTIDQELENNDFIVLNFYRGGWCPYCNLELKALLDINKELKDLKTSLIAISPQTPDESLSTQEKLNLDFKILSDKGNIVAKSFGLTYALPEDIYLLLKQMGMDIEKYNADDSHVLPVPGTFIINKQKEIIYAYVNEDYRNREEPQTILDIIKENS
ncbi:peroxiredoxin-like family protein [Arcobacteraceae bacterium]|nr:peroxiredoxin-like family protein [Arcobacteraceae bacterium]